MSSTICSECMEDDHCNGKYEQCSCNCRSTPPESEIDAILETLVKNFASLEEDSDGLYWWGHDTNLGDQSEAFTDARAALSRLIAAEVRRKLEKIANQYFIADNETSFNGRHELIFRSAVLAELEAGSGEANHG